jgi:hypothetical protein
MTVLTIGLHATMHRASWRANEEKQNSSFAKYGAVRVAKRWQDQAQCDAMITSLSRTYPGETSSFGVL